MAKRYGRKQRRAARQKIAGLEKQVIAESSQRKDWQDRYRGLSSSWKDLENRIREIFHDHSPFLPELTKVQNQYGLPHELRIQHPLPLEALVREPRSAVVGMDLETVSRVRLWEFFVAVDCMPEDTRAALQTYVYVGFTDGRRNEGELSIAVSEDYMRDVVMHQGYDFEHMAERIAYQLHQASKKLCR